MDNNQDDEFHADLIAFLFGNKGDNQEVGVEEIPEAIKGVQENVEGFVQNPEEGLRVEGNPQVVQVQENVESFVQNPEEGLGVEGNPQVVQVQENVEGFVQNPEEGLGVEGNPQLVQVQENPAADAEQAQGAEILSDLDKAAVVVYNARDSHDDHVGTSKKRGRPRKYATPEEARAAKTEKQRQRRRLRRITTVQGGEIPTDDTDQELIAHLESVLEEDTESTAENKPSREITDEEFDDSHKVFEDWHDDSEFSWKEPSEPNPEECSGVPRNKRRVETTIDDSEQQVIETMQKIASDVNNPTKFGEASKLAIQLIQARNVKAETSDHFFSILEAAMTSSTSCTDPSIREDIHALFSTAQDISECLNEKQKKQLKTWTIRAVVANDLLTGDSLLISVAAGQLQEAISDLPVATEDGDRDEATAKDREEEEAKIFVQSQREALVLCLEIAAARRYETPWSQTVIDMLAKHAFENRQRFTSKQRNAIETLWEQMNKQ